MAIHSNHKYKVIYSFLKIHSLYSKTLLSFYFSAPSRNLFNQLSMKRMRTRNGPGTSRDSSSGENDNMMRIIQGMMESQLQQTELLRQGLLTVP